MERIASVGFDSLCLPLPLLLSPSPSLSLPPPPPLPLPLSLPLSLSLSLISSYAYEAIAISIWGHQQLRYALPTSPLGSCNPGSQPEEPIATIKCCQTNKIDQKMWERERDPERVCREKMRKGKKKELGQWNIAYNNNKKNNNKKNINYNL